VSNASQPRHRKAFLQLARSQYAKVLLRQASTAVFRPDLEPHFYGKSFKGVENEGIDWEGVSCRALCALESVYSRGLTYCLRVGLDNVGVIDNDEANKE
jgi:hypothetical protein